MKPTEYHLDAATTTPDQGPQLLDTEWLLTDGLGGFAMGTALGAPTRRYHALFTAAVRPPVERVRLVAQVVEKLTIDGSPDEHWLTPLHFEHAEHRPQSPTLAAFDKGPNWCRWTWDVPQGPRVEKTLELARGESLARLRYRIDPRGTRGSLELRPLLALCDFHALNHRTEHHYTVRPAPAAIEVATPDASLFIHQSGLDHTSQPETWRNVYLHRDALRGQDCVEELFVPGLWHVRFEQAAPRPAPIEVELRFSTAPDSDDAVFAPVSVIGREPAFSRIPADDAEARDAIEKLVEAAGHFVVARGLADARPGVTVIAGYPWFADWGRDTMIALPGLLLETGRFDDALSTLELFGRHVRRGLVPNRFDDYTGGAHYNTVDASLWFLHAATEYRLRSGDDEGFARLVDPCIQIVEAYQHGTDYEIHLSDDGLIAAGSPDTQLTWMDAQRDGVTFTPRFGKCVEINALWHHGLRRLIAALGDHAPASISTLEELADRCAESFASFVNPEGGLYDRLEPGESRWRPIAEIRPNQIFAASLAESPLDADHRARVVEAVRTHLLTPYGLRTLAPSDHNYQPRYEGNLFERDRAYHNGTVWPWLIGAYVEAALRVDASKQSRQTLRALLRPLVERMSTVCLGQVSEVCSAETPHAADGCPAQAWSVAELLRAFVMLASAGTTSPPPARRR